MVAKSKIINDINNVERLRKLVVVGYTLPTSAYIIFILLSYLLGYAKISNPIIPVLLFFIVSPQVIFTPYFFYVLFKEKRFGWLTLFIVLVILPATTAFIIFGVKLFMMIWMFVFVFPFFLFCFLIKFSVEEWIREYNWEQQLIEQRKEWEEKKKEGLL